MRGHYNYKPASVLRNFPGLSSVQGWRGRGPRSWEHNMDTFITRLDFRHWFYFLFVTRSNTAFPKCHPWVSTESLLIRPHRSVKSLHYGSRRCRFQPRLVQYPSPPPPHTHARARTHTHTHTHTHIRTRTHTHTHSHTHAHARTRTHARTHTHTHTHTYARTHTHTHTHTHTPTSFPNTSSSPTHAPTHPLPDPPPPPHPHPTHTPHPITRPHFSLKDTMPVAIYFPATVPHFSS